MHRSQVVLLKEAVAYSINQGSSVFCTLLYAAKALDRANYVKLFEIVLQSQLPPACVSRYVGS